MSRVRIGRVLRAPVEVLHDPIEPAPQVVFRPSLDVVQVQLFCSLLLPVELDRIATGHDNLVRLLVRLSLKMISFVSHLDVLEALVLEVLIPIKHSTVLVIRYRRLIGQDGFQLFL